MLSSPIEKQAPAKAKPWMLEVSSVSPGTDHGIPGPEKETSDQEFLGPSDVDQLSNDHDLTLCTRHYSIVTCNG